LLLQLRQSLIGARRFDGYRLLPISLSGMERAVAHEDDQRLRIGDRVGFAGSTVHATGVVIEELLDDYVRVRWADFSAPTTHRMDTLELHGVLISTDAMVSAA
jgi:hypothetical protein